MQIQKPNAVYMDHNCTPEQFIEKIGRTCYKSEDKITEDSAKGFVSRLIKSKHWAMLEHETVYTIMDPNVAEIFLNELFHQNIPTDYLITTYRGHNFETVVSGSIRAFHDIFEAYYPNCDGNPPCVSMNYMFKEIKTLYPWAFEDIPDPLFKITVPNETNTNKALTREQFVERFKDYPNILFRHLTHTVRFSVDRGVTHEFCRHRRTSYAMESTRYVSYNKGKYGSEITVIEPSFYEPESEAYKTWKEGCLHDEKIYMELTNNLNRAAQEARDNLPHSVKAELIMTATESQWQHFIDLRDLGLTGKPHPQAQEAAHIWGDILTEITNGRVSNK